jgi:hypothetical protein
MAESTPDQHHEAAAPAVPPLRLAALAAPIDSDCPQQQVQAAPAHVPSHVAAVQAITGG